MRLRVALIKIRHGTAVSPIPLVRGDAPQGIVLQVVDGYHRVCASYHVDENSRIPSRIAGWNARPGLDSRSSPAGMVTV